MKKILYLYSGSRKNKFQGQIGLDYPDTQFYGLNYLKKFDLEAEYKEWQDFAKQKFWHTKIGFRIRHLLLFFFTRGYDLVFGSSILYMMVFKKIFKTRRKFVLFNIGLQRTLTANKKNQFKYALISSLLKELDGVVCLANFQREQLESVYPFLRGKVSFVPLGVDTQFYQPGYEGRGEYILSVGRDNGRDYKTVMEVVRKLPEREFHIVCSKRNLENIGEIPKNVKVFYDLSPSELHKKYQEAILLLLLTHQDSFLDGADCSGQTVLLDAMANGLPVIISRKKYLGDYVTDGKEAILVDCYNATQTALAINSLLEDGEGRHRLALSARKRAELEFSTEKMAEGLSGVFRSLL
ncbi:MAG: glycosyltransferase family 4 protein [Patescibacteria group bacterium]